jgi:hypothetical protein
MPSNGSIVFEKEDEEDEEEAATRRYKILTYEGHTVYLQQLAGMQIIDLHNPDSVEEIREWFENLESAFDSPFGYNTTIFSPTVGQHTHQINPHGHHTHQVQPYPYTITTSPHTQPTYVGTGAVGWSPNAGAWTGTQPNLFIGGGGTQTTQLTVSNQAQQDHLFSFNSFGSLSLGP